MSWRPRRQCLYCDLGGDLGLSCRSCERPRLTLCEWRAAHASTLNERLRTSERSMHRNALNAVARSVARACPGPRAGPGTDEEPSEL